MVRRYNDYDDPKISHKLRRHKKNKGILAVLKQLCSRGINSYHNYSWMSEGLIRPSSNAKWQWICQTYFDLTRALRQGHWSSAVCPGSIYIPCAFRYGLNRPKSKHIPSWGIRVVDYGEFVWYLFSTTKCSLKPTQLRTVTIKNDSQFLFLKDWIISVIINGLQGVGFAH